MDIFDYGKDITLVSNELESEIKELIKSKGYYPFRCDFDVEIPTNSYDPEPVIVGRIIATKIEKNLPKSDS